MIPPENLPSVLKEATNFNSLKPDELEYRTSSVFPGPSDISIPLLHIDHTEKDLEICTRPAEEFYKEVALDMGKMSFPFKKKAYLFLQSK